MANKKIYAAMSGTAIATVIASALSTTALAKSTDILVQGKDNNQYQYNINDLVDSFIGDKVLYNDFMQRGQAIAYYDDVKKGYVDLNKIVDGYTENSQEFDLDKFTESVKETLKVEGNIDKVSEKDGKVIVEEDKQQETLKVESVSAINKTGVTVKLSALEKDMAGATIQVKDPAGNMVAVVPQNLEKGATTATFPFTAVPSEIKAGNWTVEGQTFTILSSNAKLSGLTLDKGIWDKDFKDIEQAYNVYVGSDVDTVNVTPTADAGATLTATYSGKTIVLDNGKANDLSLGNAVGQIPIAITVIAPDKTTSKTYTVTVDRAAANQNNDANLTALTVVDDVTPDAKNVKIGTFKPATTEYAAAVKKDVKSVKVTPTAVDATAKVFINGKDASVAENKTVDLAVGNNEIEVKIIAADQVTTKTYKITVNKAAETASSVKTLNSLTLSSGTLNGFTADSDEGANGLTATVANNVQDLTITPVAKNGNATITAKAYKTAADNVGNALEVVKNGASYTIKGLAEGVNTVKVTVTPEDASEAQDYTLTVTRASATASDVTALNKTGGIKFVTANSIGIDRAATANLKDFDPLKTDYSVNVKNDQTNVKVETTPVVGSGETVEVKLNGVTLAQNTSGNLRIGENIITVKVTAENGIATRTYTLKVNRADVTASAVKTLNSLGLSAGELAGFKADSNEGAEALTAKVANSVKDLTITPVATDAKAIVEVTAVNGGNKLEVVKNGASYTIKGLKEDANNAITIKVTPEDASEAQEYKLTVTRVAANANDNAFLATVGGLQLNFNNAGATTIDGYKSDTTIYTVNTAYTNSKVTVTPTLNDAANAIVTVNGKAVATGTASNAIALAVGQNKVEVKVTAADGTTTKTYTVIINRAAETASDVSTLKGLTLSVGTLNGFKADDATANALSTSVLNSVKDLTITPALTDAKAKVVVTAKDAANKDLVVETKDGVYTVKALSEGRNTITVKVTAEDGIKSTTYTLAASRAAQGANIIAKLTKANGLVVDNDADSDNGTLVLSQPFAEDKTDYKVYVDNVKDKIFIKPTLDVTAEEATITINGKAATNAQYTAGLPIAIGDNNFVITITAADLTTTKTYNVDVVRASAASSKDATLSAITDVTPGKLNETFNTNTTEYTANVSYLVSTFTFKPVVTDANARTNVKVQGGGAVVKNADGSYTITGLATGAGNIITVTNTAQDSITTKAYTITVTKDAAPDAPELAGVQVADALGQENNGKTELTLPALPGGATKFVAKVAEDANNEVTPKVGDALKVAVGQYVELNVVNNKVIVDATNGNNIAVAAVDANNKVVAFKNVKADVKAYQPAARGTLEGTVTFNNDDAVSTAVGGAEKKFKITVDEIDKNITVEDSVATKEALLLAINNALDASATAEWSANKIKITSASEGANSKITVDGENKNTFFGDAPTVQDGKNSKN